MAWRDGSRFAPSGKPVEREKPVWRDEQCLVCGTVGQGDFCLTCQREDEGVLGDGR